MKTLSINLDFGVLGGTKAIQTKLESVPAGTWIEMNSLLSYKKTYKGNWARVNTQTGASMGTAKRSSYNLAKDIYNMKMGYKKSGF